MTKFNQILKKQQREKKAHNDQTEILVEHLTPVQRRAITGTQYGVLLKRMDVDLIDSSPYQPRLITHIDQDELQQLADNIRQHGQINPIVVRPKNGRYELIGGERRLYAIRDILKLKDIDCLIKDLSDEKAALMALVDNINRTDLSDYEIAYAVKQTCELFSYPLDQVDFITEKFNISRNKYYRLISLFDLPDFIAEDLAQTPQALSGSGASLLKTALNRAIEQIGRQSAIALLKEEWQYYLTAEFSKSHKRNTQFIKIFEQKAQILFTGQEQQQTRIRNQAQNNDVFVEKNLELKEPISTSEIHQTALFNHTGKKIGSLKCSESLKGKAVLSIRMSIDQLDAEKMEFIKQFLQNLDTSN